jgi:uncharacterized protein
MIEVLPRGIRFDGCRLIAGFHGIGATGYYAVKFIVESLDAKRVAYIDSEFTAPVSTTRRGRVVTPHELYKYRDLVFLKAEVPINKDNETVFYREFSKWVVSSGFTEAALIGGLDSTLRSDESTYRVVFTSAFKPRGLLAKSKVLEDELIIVGPVAIMLNYFEMVRFPAYAVLAYANADRVDPRAAASAIDVLSQVYGFNVDTKPLIEGAEKIEAELKREARREATVKGESIYA